MQRVFPVTILLLLTALLAVFLINLPMLYRDEGLPGFPALLAGQACLIGLAICLYGLYVFVVEPRRNRNRLMRERASDTTAPWLKNSQWANRRLTHTRKGKVLFLWLFVCNWWGAIWFFVTDRGDQFLEQSLPVILLCLVIVLIGVVMLWSAVTNSINWVRFGTTSLFIDTLPGQPGENFKGHIEIGFKPESRVPTKLQLSGFVRHWTQHISADGVRRVNDRYDEAPFHESEKRIKTANITATGRYFRVPVNVPVPGDARPSGPCDADSEVIWKIVLESKSPNGGEFSVDFEIPVFETVAAAEGKHA